MDAPKQLSGSLTLLNFPAVTTKTAPAKPRKNPLILPRDNRTILYIVHNFFMTVSARAHTLIFTDKHTQNLPVQKSTRCSTATAQSRAVDQGLFNYTIPGSKSLNGHIKGPSELHKAQKFP